MRLLAYYTLTLYFTKPYGGKKEVSLVLKYENNSSHWKAFKPTHISDHQRAHTAFCKVTGGNDVWLYVLQANFFVLFCPSTLSLAFIPSLSQFPNIINPHFPKVLTRAKVIHHSGANEDQRRPPMRSVKSVTPSQSDLHHCPPLFPQGPLHYSSDYQNPKYLLISFLHLDIKWISKNIYNSGKKNISA